MITNILAVAVAVVAAAAAVNVLAPSFPELTDSESLAMI